MKIKQVSYEWAVANISNPNLYRVILCDDSNYKHSGRHYSARLKAMKRCSVEEIELVKDSTSLGFVLIEND